MQSSSNWHPFHIWHVATTTHNTCCETSCAIKHRYVVTHAIFIELTPMLYMTCNYYSSHRLPVHTTAGSPRHAALRRAAGGSTAGTVPSPTKSRRRWSLRLGWCNLFYMLEFGGPNRLWRIYVQTLQIPGFKPDTIRWLWKEFDGCYGCFYTICLDRLFMVSVVTHDSDWRWVVPVCVFLHMSKSQAGLSLSTSTVQCEPLFQAVQF